MEFSEKLIDLRRRAGLSQEQLADQLGVTRQSVSKWEGGAAMPELSKLIALSELFGVSVDYLIKDDLEMPDTIGGTDELSAEQAERLEQKVDDLVRSIRGDLYAYDSKTKIFGLPLVSVRIGFANGKRLRKKDVALGIIAIGNVAIGAVTLGLISAGLFSVGCVSFGLLALGFVALGPIALGIAACGYVALGVSVIGVYAGGVAAVGSEVAVGVAAASKVTAIGQETQGANVLLWGDGLTAEQVRAFLSAHHPDLWPPLRHVLVWFGAHIK